MPKGDEKSLGHRLAAWGWKTGSVLTAEHAKAIAKSLQRGGKSREVGPDEILVVVSQTCDIVVPNLDVEPYVDVLLAKRRPAIDRTKANLRSTRHLSFPTRKGGQAVEAHAADRFLIGRELLDGYAPDEGNSLDQRSSEQLCSWLALRYTRPAWPDALVKRLPPRKEIEVVLREVALAVAEIRVGISDVDKELPDSTPYKLAVYAVMDAEEYATNEESRRRCTKAFVDFLNLLRKQSGIEVLDDSDVVPGNEFTWQMVQMTDLWNMANLTSDANN